MAQPPPGGFNNKWRPSGSGTTSQKRKEAREAKQWSFLEGDNPSGKKCLEKHLASLDAARKKCLDKLQHAEEEEALEKAEQAHKKAMKKQRKAKQSLEKESLEKDVDMEEVKVEAEPLEKGKPGKHGPRKASLVPADTLEKERQLKAKLHASLEKERQYKAKLQEALEKAKSAAGTGASSSSKPAGPMQSMPLVGQLDEALEKAKKALEKAKAEEVIHICVDWHNTLEKDDDVSADNMAALTCLLQVAKVHLISFVGSGSRKKQVLKDMKMLPQYDKLSTSMAIFNQLGEDGKVDWACHLGCTVIFDDQPEIIKEAKQWGLDAYGIAHPRAKHKGQFWATFAEAVLDYLDKLAQYQ